MNRVVRSLGKLSERWLKKSFSFRKKALKRLEEKSRFSRSQAEALLDALFSELTASKLSQLLKAELRDPRVLDGFRRDPVTKNFHRALGPQRILHIFAANVPNPAVVSFVLGMLVKAQNVGKVSSRDPGILDIFLDSLRVHDPQLAKMNFLIRDDVGAGLVPARTEMLIKLGRPQGSPLRRWIERSDLVVAYGSDETLSEIRKNVPEKIPFVGYGHRVSFSLYTRESLKRKIIAALAAKTAKDIWMMDQRGCLSPTVIYVERGGEVSPIAFAGLLKKKLDVFSENGRWTVFCDKSARTFPLSSGRKIIFVREFSRMEQVYRELGPVRKYLSAVALEAPRLRRFRIADALTELGVSRICSAGELQKPPLTWHHDGRPNIASWLRWTDIEI